MGFETPTGYFTTSPASQQVKEQLRRWLLVQETVVASSDVRSLLLQAHDELRRQRRSTITGSRSERGLFSASTKSATTGADASAAESGEGCEDEAALRIFLRDAARTFMDEGHRTRMIALLKRVWPENRDYHQGLGYVSSLLMLLFDADTTARILLRLTREERYTPGYWRAAPEPYVRDAMVYARLVAERYPAVDALLTSACVVPEAYAS